MAYARACLISLQHYRIPPSAATYLLLFDNFGVIAAIYRAACRYPLLPAAAFDTVVTLYRRMRALRTCLALPYDRTPFRAARVPFLTSVGLRDACAVNISSGGYLPHLLRSPSAGTTRNWFAPDCQRVPFTDRAGHLFATPLASSTAPPAAYATYNIPPTFFSLLSSRAEEGRSTILPTVDL